MKKDKTEKFIKNWSLRRSQGKNKYIIVNSIIYTIGILIGVILIRLYTDNDVNFFILIGLCISGVIGSVFGWHENEKKYNNIMKE